MKRVLRFIVLGPIFLIAMSTFTLVSPLIHFLMWLIDDKDARGIYRFVSEMWVYGWKELTA